MTLSLKPNRSLFDLDLLRAIVVVADCGSFTTAATRLHSTQSTISQKVRRLEEMVGHRLLERGNREQALYHLGRIASICGTDCEEYRSLAAALDKPTGTALVY